MDYLSSFFRPSFRFLYFHNTLGWNFASLPWPSTGLLRPLAGSLIARGSCQTPHWHHGFALLSVSFLLQRWQQRHCAAHRTQSAHSHHAKCEAQREVQAHTLGSKVTMELQQGKKTDATVYAPAWNPVTSNKIIRFGTPIATSHQCAAGRTSGLMVVTSFLFAGTGIGIRFTNLFCTLAHFPITTLASVWRFEIRGWTLLWGGVSSEWSGTIYVLGKPAEPNYDQKLLTLSQGEPLIFQLQLPWRLLLELVVSTPPYIAVWDSGKAEGPDPRPSSDQALFVERHFATTPNPLTCSPFTSSHIFGEISPQTWQDNLVCLSRVRHAARGRELRHQIMSHCLRFIIYHPCVWKLQTMLLDGPIFTSYISSSPGLALS